MAEHRLIGTMNPRCARCQRSLIDIVTHPGVPCAAARLPLFDVAPTPAKADLPLSEKRKRA